MPMVTRVGDAELPHCSGKSRAMGSPNVRVNGLPLSRQGDPNTGHRLPPNVPPCPSHSASITTGSTTVFVNGRGCGRSGDDVTGCTRTSVGSPNVFAGG